MNAFRFCLVLSRGSRLPLHRWAQAARRSALAVLLALTGSWASLSQAQTPAPTPVADLIFTVGTTIRDTSNQDWSFVLVGAAEAAVVRGKRFAVYGKAGDAGSAATYTPRGTLARHTDVTSINASLNRSIPLGQDLDQLGNAINVLLRRVPGITNQSVPQKVLTLFQNAETNLSSATSLALLTVSNPGLRICLGQAFAEIAPTITTYEVREINPGTGQAENVVGRVTVTPGAPVVLPAPGRPFQVMTNHPDDHLQVRLRWGTPDPLRRLSLLGYGFNVWRIGRVAADGAGFHVTPPTIAQLLSNPAFRRINEGPVITTRDYSAGSGPGAANDPADRENYFVGDDNGRYRAGGTPLADGAEFYYFVTARDVLGRDGLPSLGGLGRACRRIPPLAPIDLSARDVVQVLPLPGGANTNVQRIRVSWLQRTNSEEQVSEYWIYRWPNPGDALRSDLPATLYRIGVVPHLAGTNANAYLDNGPTAPVTPGLSNFWYTVRAVSLAACDPLPSPHSPPVSAVLRVREGPAAGTGRVRGSCGTPAVRYQQFQIEPVADAPVDRALFRLRCVRRDPGIAWVRFAITNGNAGVTELGPIYFPPGGDTVEVDHAPSNDFGPAPVTIGCTVGNYYDAVSRGALYTSNTTPPVGQRWHVGFLAGQLLLTSPVYLDPLHFAAGGGAPDRCALALDPTADETGTVTMRFNHTTTEPVLIQASSNGPNSDVWVDVGIAFPDAAGLYAVSYPECLVAPLPTFRGCIAALPSEPDCNQHIVSASIDGRVAPIYIEFTTTPRTREYRLYRTVNGGPLTLISQGAVRHNALQPQRRTTRKDDALPSTATRLCYYLQLLDEHGNPSPLAELGCKDTTPPKPPQPTLAEPQAVGSPAFPQVALNWFCPTAGVHRFRISLQVKTNRTAGAGGGVGGGGPGTPDGSLVSADLVLDPGHSLNGFFAGVRKTVNPLAIGDLVYYNGSKLTRPINAGFGPGPQFTLVANVFADTPYQIAVEALDAQGRHGDKSVTWDFIWKTPPPLELVPWPDRPLPAVESFDARVQAVVFTNLETGRLLDRRYPVAVRIGQLPNVVDAVSNIGTPEYASYYRNSTVSSDPNSHIFKRQTPNPERADEPLLPIVMYRQQVTNSFFPKVSGDIVQVSPMIERLPWSTLDLFGQSFTVYINDRLIAVRTERSADFQYLYTYLYLRDQQPVLLGARYRYFLVRFKANREVDYIIPTNEIEIPLGSL